MVALSTGAARSVSQPDYVAVQDGLDHGVAAQAPADWLSAHGGKIPNLPGCSAIGDAHDPVMVTAQVKVPTNARSFSLDAFFLSADYPEFVCSQFVDFFVVLLDSAYVGVSPNPQDKNLAVSSFGAPINANVAYGGSGPFLSCRNGTVGCMGNSASFHNGCVETISIWGTGYDVAGTGCSEADFVGGGTGWLKVRGNVVPGETITLRFAIWDSSDGTFDSMVLLDNFRWSDQETTPGAVAAP